MIVSMIAAMAAAGASPVPPNPCKPAEACRYVETVSVKDPDEGPDHSKRIGQWLPFVRNGKLLLMPGEFVSVQISDGGPIVTAAGKLQDGDHDETAEYRLGAQQSIAEIKGESSVGMVRTLDKNPVYTAEKNRLRIVFLQDEDGANMVLRIASGYDNPVAYKASITIDTYPTEGTAVCPILASKTALESWPDPIMQIELSDFILKEQSDPAECPRG